ncbi:hypothetical protein NSQ77_19930 [Oceanobacillus sp. FSL K6-2867]|uniref:hypothetical protein n=1 Tax=Oceanobacillus sp. FSL K6-2867 TaxID=2954748 RepID=UPI0030D7FBBA
MKIKVIMDSGKEYVIDKLDEFEFDRFIGSFFNENKLPMGQTAKVLKNTLLYLGDKKSILINPSHVSSIEVLEG